MTAAQSLFRSFGALTLPLASGNRADLSELDPARDILLDLFAAALNYELGPVWRGSAVLAAQFRDTLGSGPVPVRQKLPAVPSDEALSEMKAGWPLLCVGRSATPVVIADYSIDMRSLTQRWDVDYILCPLALGGLLRVQDVLVAVGKVLTETVANRGHKAYRTYDTQGATYATNVIGTGPACCNFTDCRVVSMALGPAELSKGGPKYYACGLTLESVEVSDFSGDGTDDGEAVPLVGTTATFGLTESGDPSIIARG